MRGGATAFMEEKIASLATVLSVYIHPSRLAQANIANVVSPKILLMVSDGELERFEGDGFIYNPGS